MNSDGIGARAAALADLVAYQDGAVVSRTILKKEAGNVTLFAFDRGQALSEHTVPYDALVHVIEGRAEITVGGEPNTLAQGDVIVMPANVPHAVKAPERFKMLLIMLRV